MGENGNTIEFMIRDGTTHDVKIAPTLIDRSDLADTDILCAGVGCDSELFRDKIKKTQTQENIPKNVNPIIATWIDIYIKSGTY